MHPPSAELVNEILIRTKAIVLRQGKEIALTKPDVYSNSCCVEGLELYIDLPDIWIEENGEVLIDLDDGQLETLVDEEKLKEVLTKLKRATILDDLADV
jgi:hypothetical protein